MPPLPPVPNVIKAIVKGVSGEVNELPWANILHLAFTGASPTTAFLTALANVIANEWNVHMAPECPANITQTGVDLYDLTSPTSASVGEAYSNGGSRGDDEIPANVAYLVDYPIPRRYRGGHPRQYLLVGGNADFLDAAHWSTAFTSEVINHWAAFLEAFIPYTSGGTNITNLVNVSYISKEENPVPPYRRAEPLVDVITITTMIGNQQMASQRRRIGRHRR